MINASATNLINGVVCDYLSVDDRAIHYGDGLFETLLCDVNKIYYWQQHYQRLQQSAKRLKIECPSELLLLDDIKKLFDITGHLKTGNRTCCAIKIIITRGAAERGYQFSNKLKCNRIVSISPTEIEYSSFLSNKLLSGNLYLCEQQVSINKNLAGVKHLNRLENVLARNEWSADYIDGVMLNAQQNVIETTMANLFIVKDGQVFTPDLTLSGVLGIMRERIMLSAKNCSVTVSVIDLKIDALTNADELFISNSLIGIKSVTNLLDTKYNKQDITNIIFKNLLVERDAHVQTI